MLAKSRAYSHISFPIAETPHHESLWARFLHAFVMDAPENFGMHPDVVRMIEDERASLW